MHPLITGLVGVLIFLLGALMVYIVNYSRSNRQLQLALPPVALLYSIAWLFAFGYAAMQSEALSQYAQENVAVLGGFDLETMQVALLSLVVFSCFVAVKFVYKMLVGLLVRLAPTAGRKLISRVYAYDEERQRWFLREDFRGARKLAKNIYVAILVMGGILVFLAGAYPELSFASSIFCPAFVALILGEICFSLSGITKSEYLDQIEFEDDGASRVFQYSKLLEILSHYFGDRLIGVNAAGSRKSSIGSHEDFCRDLLSSDEREAKLAGGYFKALVDKGLVGAEDGNGKYDDLSHDLALETVRLLQGKSVMFASPFCCDYIPYVFLPVNAQLMRNNKVLVLYGPEASEPTLRSYINEGLNFVTGIPEMWTVGKLAPSGEQHPDIAIMAFSELGNVGDIINNAAYLEKVSMVLVIDPSSLLATYQIGLNYLAEYLSEGEPVSYCIFDRNSDGLVDSLSHALRTDLVEVSATAFAEGTSIGMFWDVDGEYLQHRLFPGVARYLGVGTELGLVALKSQTSKVTWAAHSAVPLADQRWIVGQYYGELLRFAELPQEQSQIDRSFEFCSDMWCVRKKNNRFLVVEDEYRNMFEAYRQFATRGSSQAFVNVLSPSYLLRDYMRENAEVFSHDPKAIPSFAPDFSKSQRNAVFSIVMAMAQSGGRMREEDLLSRLRYVGLSVVNAREALEGLLIDHIDVSNCGKDLLPEKHIVVEEEEEYVPARRDFAVNRYYSLSDGSLYSDCFSSLLNVPLVTEHPDGKGAHLGARLYGHVYQSYLPGQFVTLDGKYYEIVSISKDNGVVMRRAADHFSARRYYRQIREYEIYELVQGEGLGDVRTVSNVVVKRVAANTSVSTLGYLDMSDYGDLGGSRRVELSGIPDRRYSNKSALCIQIPGASSEVMATLTVLLNELFITIFPKDYPYVVAVSSHANNLPEGSIPKLRSGGDCGCIYILEDSLIDIGLVSCVDRNIQRILELCWDYLDWHGEMLEGKEEVVVQWELGEVPEFVAPEVKKGFFARLLDALKGLFAGGRKQEQPAEAKARDVASEVSEEDAGSSDSASGELGQSSEEPMAISGGMEAVAGYCEPSDNAVVDPRPEDSIGAASSEEVKS